MRADVVADAMRRARGALTAYVQRYGPYGAPELDVVLGHVHRVRRHGVPAARADHAGGRARAARDRAPVVLQPRRRRPAAHAVARRVVRDLGRARPVRLRRVPLAARARDRRRVPRLDHGRVRPPPEPVRTRRLQRRRLRARGGGRRDRPHRVPRPAEARTSRPTATASCRASDFIAALRDRGPAGFDVDAWAARARLRLG